MPLFCYAFLAVSFAPRIRAARTDDRTAFFPRARPAGSASAFFDPAHGGDVAALAAPVLDLRPPRGSTSSSCGSAFGDRDVDHPHVSRGGGWSAFPMVALAEILVAFHRLRRGGRTTCFSTGLCRTSPSSTLPRLSMMVVIPRRDFSCSRGFTNARHGPGPIFKNARCFFIIGFNRLLHHRRAQRDHVRGDPVRTSS